MTVLDPGAWLEGTACGPRFDNGTTFRDYPISDPCSCIIYSVHAYGGTCTLGKIMSTHSVSAYGERPVLILTLFLVSLAAFVRISRCTMANNQLRKKRKQINSDKP